MSFLSARRVLVSVLICSSFVAPPLWAQEAAPETKGEEKKVKSGEELAIERQKAEKALKEAEADMKKAEKRRRAAVANLKAAGSDRDWAKGVSEKDQRHANQLLQEGNVLLKESFFKQAVQKYEESLTHWDHPGTHYNMALAMLTLDAPTTTYRHLRKAIEHGADPLDQDKYDYALNYLALLKKQVTTLRLSCNEVGAEVRLDGRFLFRAPGKKELLLLRDDHQLEARKEGFVRTLINRRLDSDEPIQIELKLYRADELYTYHRPYSQWIPASVTALGVLVVAGGGLATYLSQEKYNDFDDGIVEDEDCVRGCIPGDSIQSERDSGDTFRTLSFIGYAAGGAIIATGISLFFLNGKVATPITPEERQELSFTPILGPSIAGVVGTASF